MKKMKRKEAGLILKDPAEFSPVNLKIAETGEEKLGQKKQCREDLKIAVIGEEKLGKKKQYREDLKIAET